MNFSINMSYDGTLPYKTRIDAIRDAGFTHAFLWWDQNDPERFEQPEHMRRRGLEIETAHLQFAGINNMWLDNAAGAALAEALLRSIDEARDCGIPTVILHLSSGFNPPPVSALGTRRFRAICERAEKYGVAVALVNCTALSAADIEGILTLLLGEFPIRRVNIDMPAWIPALGETHPLRESIYRAVVAAAGELEKIGELPRAFEMGMGEDAGAYFEDAATDLGTGEATVRLRVPTEKYFEVLSSLSGTKIESDAELFDAFCTLAKAKKEYDRVAVALADDERKGYGIVMPTVSELTLKEPQIVRQAGGYAVRLRAAAKSIHMIRADIEAEVNPIVGSEAQSEELVRSIEASLGEAPEKIWDTNMFGKSLYELVSESLTSKLAHIPEDAQKRLSETLERVINEGSGGLICIIL